ncbi:MAG: GntR family transcriptional regulator [candidate division KSB1 bacterium]|nr:GntR family transcriptional regulator [candidate division KSB1 bacterium]
MHETIHYFKEISVTNPFELIISQIKTLISSGILKPGDRLPAERALMQRFGVGRGHIRKAIQKLEFYGILETRPQSGTFVASIGVKALEGLITNILKLDSKDVNSLIETRTLLEIEAVGLAATRVTDSELEELEEAHLAFKNNVRSGKNGIDEDLLFHLKITECAHNAVLQSLLAVLIPDIITLSNDCGACRDGRSSVAIRERYEILNALQEHDAARASGSHETSS